MTITVSVGVVQHEGPRQRWIDLAKGICIILVVMMHTVLGIEKEIGQAGVLHAVVAWTKPFRMPDFFLLSGYLAAGVGALSWRSFLDRKMLRYAYFYVLWLSIVTIVKTGGAGFVAPDQLVGAFAFGLIEPFSTLWFIYILPFFMLAARMARGLLAFAFGIGAVLLHLWASTHFSGGAYAMVSQVTPSVAINSFALFFVFFFAGYMGHRRIDAWFDLARRRPLTTLSVLVVWASLHSYSLYLGIVGIPGLTLFFGLAGGLAVTLSALLLERASGFDWLAYCGHHSMAIYLAFVIPMAVSREFLIGAGIVEQPDVLMILVLAVAIIAPLVLERAVRGRAFNFLFSRPQWARMYTAKGRS
ncbi:MAG: acyltransferase family protein [Sphingomonadales bacterium]|nr:acyltransferase family protein [Sphingomonadales bacterium]